MTCALHYLQCRTNKQLMCIKENWTADCGLCFGRWEAQAAAARVHKTCVPDTLEAVPLDMLN